jgi:hypothetical protein
MKINFDMDGTLVDFYGVENWLEMLKNEDTTPYAEAKPLVNFSLFARYLNKLAAIGYEINIISWTARNGSPHFNSEIASVKREYLRQHLPSVTFTNIYIVDYGTPKHEISNGILFDDESLNRDDWGTNAYQPCEIFTVLKSLLNREERSFSDVFRPKNRLQNFSFVVYYNCSKRNGK